MEILTTKQVWADFYDWFKKTMEWKTLSTAQRQRLQNTNQEVRSGRAGIKRISKAFERYRPGVYHLSQGWVKTEDQVSDLADFNLSSG